MDSPLGDPLPRPRLPPELERTIFEEAALSCFHHNIPALMLTAWRVKFWWVRLKANEKRNHSDDRILQGWNLPLLSRIAAVLAVCRDVSTNRFVLGDPAPQLFPALNELCKLRYLTVHWRSLCIDSGRIDFACRVFRHLTHLELIDCDSQVDLPDALVGLDAIQNLTHIAFDSVDVTDAAAVHDRIRRMSRSLQCIVFMEIGRAKHLPRSADDRFVALRQILCFEDWLRGATTGKDYWWLAGRFVAAKGAGKVDRSGYEISWEL
ncbi:hypothetical protein R3P38DRAFT_2672510 [Favolaschia claudopus]|uniref:Uncharacterized protein n=1 Tax=Favolaschia claudopus TaxID=2862362 RepID=A0AAV9Z0I1_9AGAR